MRRADGAPIREATGLALMVARREKGLTQLELAHRATLSQAQVARFELGTHSPTIEQVAAIARALGLTRMELWERTEAAMTRLKHPSARAMFLEGRVRVRAPKLRE